VLYYAQDQLGSTRLLTNATGNPAGRYTYNPYGSVASHTGASTPFSYAGQYTDPETGLIYLRARYYDPTTAQFMSRDPLQSITKQPYVYASDDPVNQVDLTGQIDPSTCFNDTTGIDDNPLGFQFCMKAAELDIARQQIAQLYYQTQTVLATLVSQGQGPPCEYADVLQAQAQYLSALYTLVADQENQAGQI